MGSALRKERRSFTLSRESVEYLELEQKRRRAPSASSVLDEILRERQQEYERQKLEASMVSYYDSLTDEEMAEDRAWGAFGESQISRE